MAEIVYTPFRADRLRLTRLDGCGKPVIGARSMLVSDGLISVEWKGQTDTGTDVEVKNAKGNLRVSSPAAPTLKYIDVTIKLTGIDPDAYEMTTGQQLVVDGQGNSVGIRGQEFVGNDFGIGLETWTGAQEDEGAECDANGNKLFGYFLLPFLVNGMVGDVTLNDGALDCTLTARTKRGSDWGTGPASYLVADSSATGNPVTPAVLATAIGPTDHYHMQVTPVAPPAVTAGAVALA